MLQLIMAALFAVYVQSVGSIRIAFYDFDQTISSDHLFSKLSHSSPGKAYGVDQQLEALSHCDTRCLTDSFGGDARIEALRQHFSRLQSNGIILSIVSFGYKDVISQALHRVGLLEYFDEENIFGREALSVAKVRRSATAHALKSVFIQHHFKEIPPSGKLFIDNDERNMQYVAKHDRAIVFDTDKYGHIDHGLNASQLAWIEQECDL